MKLHIQIIVDNLGSWVIPTAHKLVKSISLMGHESELIHDYTSVREGDILVLLSCENIVGTEILRKHKNNLVVHASDLPSGKGWSPLTWQILEGKNEIHVTLFEAVEKVDAGAIYGQEILKFDGHELIDELRQKLNIASINLILEFIKKYPIVKGRKQEGDESFYKRRKKKDSKIDPHKSLVEQFNILRIVDNDRYPAFFELYGKRYIIRIEKDNLH